MEAGALFRALKPSNMIFKKPIGLRCSSSSKSPTKLYTANGRTVKRAYDGLLLDAGGTLLQLAKPVEDIYASIGHKYGLNATPADIKQGFKRAFSAPWPEKLRYQGDGRPFWKLVVSEATGCANNDYFEEVYEYYANGDAWHLPTGAYETILILKEAGVKMAVVSNFDTRLRKLLQELNVIDLFDAVIISSEVGFEKPDAKIFETALDEINVEASKAVHVGDDEKADKLGAKTVGINCWLWVCVHELGFFGRVPKVYVFNGAKEITKDQVLEQMGFFLKKPRPATGVVAGVRDGLSQESISRFLLPAADCEFALNSVLDELQKDPWLVPADQRAPRSTGTALTIAAHLLGVCVPGSGARIMAFLGGPTTEGPGSIVSKALSEPIRSHKDLDKDAAPFFNKAVKLYEGLAKQLIHQGHVLDVFACALDQVGVAELKVAVEKTGGLVVLAESFGHSVFKDSLLRVFQSGDTDLGLSSNGIFEVNFSKDIKIQGILGPCASLEKKGALCSDTSIGQGGTTAWKMCGLDKSTSLCLIFDIVKKESSDVIGQAANNQFYFQFLTYYQHSNGQMRLRATTLSRRWVTGPGNIQDLVAGFDQEAAAVVMGRLVSFKMETEAEFDPIRWLDKTLIHLCSRFGDYQKDNPSSFVLSPRLSIIPQFVFNLRRSQFVQVFNNSPDETAYFRMVMNRENVANSVVMIQPSLISYAFNSGAEPALLDVASIAADRILLLDSYFTVVVFHGSTIAQWRKAGYQNEPEHKVFAQLLQAPLDDADAIVKERFPVPRLVICDQHGSQARFLLAKLNPSATYNSEAPPTPGGDVLFTDDVSFEIFLDHLQRLAVQ